MHRRVQNKKRAVERPDDVQDTTKGENNAADRFKNVSSILSEKKRADLFSFVANPKSFSQVRATMAPCAVERLRVCVCVCVCVCECFR